MKVLRYFAIASMVALPAFAGQPPAKPSASAQAITVYRTATCGCCGKWVDHMKTSGFNPTVHMVQSMDATPPRKGLPVALHSCHNASLEGYNVEGHVPADVVRKLLRERPKVKGLAVAGMPAGSPGMESPNPVAYDVVAYDAAGKTSVFARVEPKR